ncbi:MAG TPA: transglycosylase family protein [Actinomycetospora sp.]|nr:transglycosylase family protein [Actinomycetospora sp.]
MDVRSLLPTALDSRVPAGRHRAPRRPGRLGRAGLALVAAGAPVIPAALLAAPAAHADTDWDALAECESGGDWSINTGNGFGGGLQFTDSTWRAFGGSGQPENASRAEQIRVAERVKAGQGMNAWPTCSRKTGQTDDSPNSSVPSGSSSSSSSSDDEEDSDSDATETRTVRDTGSSSGAESYTVEAGDTLSSIAAAHGSSWRSLAQANPDIATDPDLILPGQTLTVG